MDHFAKEHEPVLDRIGFHYPGNSEDFSLSAAKNIIRKLKRAKAKWLIINNPPGRAVPEEYIRYLSSQDINLIVHFGYADINAIDLSDLNTILYVYGKWGVKYASLIDQPNMRHRWGEKMWGQNNIVEFHAQLFIEFARICVRNDIQPVFSPLKPAGDYWDLAFLENSFQILQNHADPSILRKLVLSAFGWHYNHPVDWGTGGKTRWPNVKPMIQNTNSQDQCGFRAYEWVSEISSKVFGRKLPTIIFEAGNAGPDTNEDHQPELDWSHQLQQAVRLLSGENGYAEDNPDQLLPEIGQEVIACCFTDYPEEIGNAGHTDKPQHSFQKGNLPTRNDHPLKQLNQDFVDSFGRYIYIDQPVRKNLHEILEQLDRYIKNHKPYIGFSLVEGSEAAYLIAITEDKEKFSDQNSAILSEANIVRVVSQDELQRFE